MQGRTYPQSMLPPIGRKWIMMKKKARRPTLLFYFITVVCCVNELLI